MPLGLACFYARTAHLRSGPYRTGRRARFGRHRQSTPVGRNGREHGRQPGPRTDRVRCGARGRRGSRDPVDRETLGGLAAPLAHGQTVTREAVRLGGELARVAVGRSEIAAARGDRRFSDPAWSGNPLFSRHPARLPGRRGRAHQGGRGLRRGTDDARRAEQARFASNILISTLAPTNYLPTNPAALKRRSTRAGAAWRAGSGTSSTTCGTTAGCRGWSTRTRSRWVATSRSAPARSSSATRSARCCSTSRTTEQVSARPLLIIPPPINRFYFLDLSPGRSFVEYAVEHGPADLHAQLAQPDRGAGRLEPRHLRRARARRDRRRRARSAAATT